MAEPEAKFNDSFVKNARVCKTCTTQYCSFDTKPENIMFENKNGPNVKLVSSGLATKFDADELVKVSPANVEFAAPESIERDLVGFSTDMWTVGVLTMSCKLNFFLL